jgi:hypothetical protein
MICLIGGFYFGPDSHKFFYVFRGKAGLNGCEGMELLKLDN